MTKPGRFCNVIGFWFLKCSILVLHSVKLFPSLNVTSIFLKPKCVKMGDLKGSTPLTLKEAGDPELFWRMLYTACLKWEQQQFFMSDNQMDLDSQCLRLKYSSLILVAQWSCWLFFFFFFVAQIPISRQIHHLSTSNTAALFSAK